MTFSDALALVSLLASVISAGLAIFAILFARSSERQTQQNLSQTKDSLSTQTSSVKDSLSEQTATVRQLLSDVDKRAAVIQGVVDTAQKELFAMMKDIIAQLVIRRDVNVL